MNRPAAVAMVVPKGMLNALPCGQLLAEARHDEQGIVDGDTEPDQGHDVDRVRRHVDDVRESECCAYTAEYREDADAETEQRGDAGGEDDHEQDEARAAATQPRTGAGRSRDTCRSRTRVARRPWR